MLRFKKIRFINLCLFFTLNILWLEMLAMIFCAGTNNLNLIFLYSLCFGLSIALLVSIIPLEAIRRIFSLAASSVLSLLFITEILLYRSFGYFYPPETVFGMADDVMGSYGATILSTLKAGIIPTILCLLPIPVYILLSKNFAYKPNLFFGRIFILVAVLLLHFTAKSTIEITSAKEPFPTNSDYYYSEFEFSECTKRFGLCTSIRLNTLYSFIKPDISDITPPQGDTSRPDNKKEYNISNFDLKELSENSENKKLRTLASAFLSEAPTEKNEFSGMFNGKNLIFICAEALTPYAIDPVITPTLYKLSNEGFSFKNYYQPSFGESTLGGEYALLCSQVPGKSSGEIGLTMQLSCIENLKYSLPGLFSEASYDCFGFHNNSFTYYSRNKTHPALGLNWYGVGGCVTDDDHRNFDLNNSLSPGWPRSDNELIMSTSDILKNSNSPFFAYYLSVSGHNNYSFSENTQARKNRPEAEMLQYSERVQAYIACQLELEKALASLLKLLDEAGILDDTVIALSNDHYPYGLSSSWQENGGKDHLSELAGRELNKYERERGVFFIWNSKMDVAINIEKTTSGFDVMPTLLNLFGIEFDSRLLAGRDALSNSRGLVFFSDYSFISGDGSYFISSGSGLDESLESISKTAQTRIKNSRGLRKNCLFKHLKKN